MLAYETTGLIHSCAWKCSYFAHKISVCKITIRFMTHASVNQNHSKLTGVCPICNQHTATPPFLYIGNLFALRWITEKAMKLILSSQKQLMSHSSLSSNMLLKMCPLLKAQAAVSSGKAAYPNTCSEVNQIFFMYPLHMCNFMALEIGVMSRQVNKNENNS